MRITPLAVVILVCLFSPAAHSQSNYKASNPFRKFVKALPPVDKVEVIAVTPLITDEVERVDYARLGFVCAPDTFPYENGAVKTLIGEDAYRISAKWRKLERDYLHNDDKCLVADHILRFFQDEKLLLESQVCTLCRKITLPAIGVVSVAGSNDAPYYHFQSFLMPDSSFEQSRENFKREMIPKVGQQFTIIGLLLSGVIHQALPEHFYFERPNIQVLRVESPRRPKRQKSR